MGQICLIVDEVDTRDERLADIKPKILARGYPKTLFDSGIIKAKSIPQDILQQNTGSKKTDRQLYTFCTNAQSK